MAKAIYQIKLKNHLIPAQCEDEALDTFNVGCGYTGLKEDEVEITVAVKEEHTLKLFLLAKTMVDADRFEQDEVQAAVMGSLKCRY